MHEPLDVDLRTGRSGVEGFLEGWTLRRGAPVQLTDVVDGPGCVVLVDDEEAAERALVAGALDALIWPDEAPRLPRALRSALRAARRRAGLEMYREVLRRAPVWVMLTGPDRRTELVSEGFTAITGTSSKQLVGSLLGARTLHDAAFVQAIQRAVREKGRWTGEVVIEGWDDRSRMVSVVVRMLRSDGSPNGEVYFAEEIDTARDGSLQSWLAGRSSLPWVLCAADGRVVAASDSIRGVLNWRRTDLLGVSLEDVGFQGLLDAEQQGDRWFGSRVYEVRLDGREVGGVALTLICFRDVTVRREETERLRATTERLAAARDQARAAERAKSAFLAAMSHEIRSPLNPILGYTELLAEDAVGTSREDLDRIRRAATHLARLVDDLLQLARVESGGLELRHRTAPIGAILERVRARFAEAAVQSGKNLRVAPSDQVMRGDTDRIEQILNQLVENAVRHADPGAVDVAFVDGAIVVEDTGPGIPPDQRALVFEPFRRLDQGGVGTGLGLPLAQRVADYIGGELHLEAGERGSRFRLVLPPWWLPGAY